MHQDKDSDRLLHEADQLASKGSGPQAAKIITERAAPATVRLADRASGWNPASRWGQQRRAELVSLLRDRARAMGQYASALSSDELSRVVEQMEAQRSLEQRAVVLEQKLDEPQVAEACAPP